MRPQQSRAPSPDLREQHEKHDVCGQDRRTRLRRTRLPVVFAVPASTAGAGAAASRGADWGRLAAARPRRRPAGARLGEREARSSAAAASSTRKAAESSPDSSTASRPASSRAANSSRILVNGSGTFCAPSRRVILLLVDPNRRGRPRASPRRPTYRDHRRSRTQLTNRRPARISQEPKLSSALAVFWPVDAGAACLLAFLWSRGLVGCGFTRCGWKSSSIGASRTAASTITVVR
jgi:hypothetical protein